MQSTIAGSGLSIVVDSAGAELASLQDAAGREYLWQGSSASWKSRSPVLFPVIGGLPDGRYSLDGKEYELPSHGFARQREWEMVESGEDLLGFRLESDAKTLEVYPFEFIFDLSYRLSGSRLTVGYTIENRDSREMLFSVGGHPGFNCPLEKGLGFSDYQLRFDRPEETVRYLKKGQQLSGRTEPFTLADGILPLEHALFTRGAIILREFESDSITLEPKSSNGASVRVEFAGFPDLGIWSYPPEPAPFICIEPWFGVDSFAGDDGNFEYKSGIVHLAPGNIFRASFSIEIIPGHD